ncbi:MAG TPA: ATP-binding protein [Granulicella sp.]|nr:ATP-binding protein [Granulicella sp.]
MRRRGIREIAARTTMGIAAALGITWAAFAFHFNLSSATSLHLLLVTTFALRWGLVEASIVSLLSVLCLDYFFTDPVFAFNMNDSRDWVALFTFEGVALLASRLSNQVRSHAREAERSRSQVQKLYELSQHILLIDRQKPVDQQLATLIQATFEMRGVALWNAQNLQLARSGDCSDVTDDEVRATYSMEYAGDDVSSATSRRVLRLGTRSIGSIVLCGHSLDAASINAMLSLTAIAIERARSFSAETSAEAARQSEQLRAAVLDGLAHAFKTPLTTIISSSSGLLTMDTLPPMEKRLVALIDRQAEQLNDLTTNLLRTARLDKVDLKLRREQIDLLELIKGSIDAASQELSGHQVDVQPVRPGSAVWADRQLLQMAILQLFDNAAKYGSPDSPITIGVHEEAAEALISVRNEGCLIAPEEKEKIFQRFYRSPGSDHRASGTGIGLSVVKRITEAHHGRVWVTSDRQNGTTFFLALPRMAKEK